MIRSHFFVATFLLCTPAILISEPPEVSNSASRSGLEILFSGITHLDNSSSVLVSVDPGEKLISPCENEQTTLKEEPTTRVIQWKPVTTCPLPLVTYKGKNYILPLQGSYPSRESLSDVSTETLTNTLRAGSVFFTDYRFSSARMRRFFSDISLILETRKVKFSLPIPGIPLPNNNSHLPNAPRPFRAQKTDGVHHGWDFYVQEGTLVHAIEDGMIIHTKRDFSWEEMNHLHPGDSDLEEQENLDVYRGNTVYLKTLSGHVAIYAHLSDIPSELEKGQWVKRGDIIGRVGDSAVPDKKYLYHLHFELAMNPLDDLRAGSYTFTDILLWSFWGKGKSLDWVKKNDNTLFE